MSNLHNENKTDQATEKPKALDTLGNILVSEPR